MASSHTWPKPWREWVASSLCAAGLGDWTPTAATTELENSDVCVFERCDASAGLRASRLFIKCMDVPGLMQRFEKTGEKWSTSLRSFANELAFYRGVGQDATRALLSLGVHVPQCSLALHESASQAASTVMHQRFALGLELFDESTHYQLHTFDAAHVEAALRYIARFHAAFWSSDGAEMHAAPRLKEALFEHGCWWRKHLRPSVKFSRLPTVFLQLAAAFPESFGCTTAADASAMQTIADSVDTITAACRRVQKRTLVHGDFKTSNLFFKRQTTSGTTAAPSADDVVAIDYQWSGCAHSGLGDVAYLILGGLDAKLLPEHSTVLLEKYYDELRQRLPPTVPYTFAECLEDYDWETLDYVKTALPQLLDGLSAALLAENKLKYGWLTHEYDSEATAWLCREAIRAAQARLLQRP